MNPPRARVDPVREDFFGTTIEDPYRWMEEWESDEAMDWFRQQAAYSRDIFDHLPDREGLLARIRELGSAGSVFRIFQVEGGRVFYLKRDPEDVLFKLMMRDGDDASEMLLIDPNTMHGEEHTSIDWYRPSRDGRLIACGLSAGGGENSTLHVFDVDHRQFLDLAISRTRFGHVSWLEDGRSFLYHRYADLQPGTPASQQRANTRMFLHELGNDPENDVPVFGRGVNPTVEIDAALYPIIVVSSLSEWMVGVVFRSHGLQEPSGDFELYAAPLSDLRDPGAIQWRRVCTFEDRVAGFAFKDDTIYLRTYQDAPRFKIIATSMQTPDLPGARIVVAPGHRVIKDLVIVNDSLLVSDLDAGISRMRQVPLAGGDVTSVELPVNGTISEWARESDDCSVLLQIASWTVSPRVFRYRVDRGTMEETGWVPPLPIDFSDVEAHELAATASDGTEIPLSVIHARGLRKDGNNPTVLLAYGSYGISMSPTFLPELKAWYERGGVLAIAHVRGGGELGKEWHEAGKRLNKGNTIGDFIACAEWLIAQGYTRPELLAGEGGSAGGIPTGGALVRRPDLWAVMIMQVPMANTYRFEFYGGGPPNVPEFGTVTTEEGFRSLQIIDSYSRVQDGVPYPAVILTTGLNDFRVEPWQAGKMAARLQAATSSDNPVLLRVEFHGGHGIGSTKEQQHAEMADTLSFLLHQMRRAKG